MAFNFLSCDRDQAFLMPPSVAEWLPEDHLAWFMIDVVGQMDLAGFFAGYRADGRGGAAFDPQMMVALLLYSYAIGERSSRKIEQLCTVDVAYRVLTANNCPDHTTVARFRQQHEDRLENLFVESVRLCHQAGLGRVGTVAIDGRKVVADASLDQNRTLDGIEREVRRWFEEAAAIDAAEDALYGADKRGDELPPELRDRRSRLARLAQAKARLDAEKLAVETEHERKLAKRAAIIESGKKPMGRPPHKQPKADRDTKANITDLDSRIMKSRRGFVQGYNAQAVVTEDQIVIGAQVVQDVNDINQLIPMLVATEETLDAAGIDDPIDVVLADAGYGTEDELASFEAVPEAPELFIAIQNRHKQGRNPDPDTARGRMHTKLRTDHGRSVYKKRGQTVEAVFGQHHTVQKFDRFNRRGLAAVQSEWKLVNAAHNLLKLHRKTVRETMNTLASTPASTPA